MNYIFVVILIGVIVLVHEWGHFFAAKRVGIPIKVFSIGFGPSLVKFKRHNTEYRISWIPFGGYVLPDIDNENDYFKISPNKRILMALGGPISSLIFTIFCFVIYNLCSLGISFNSLLILPIHKTYNLIQDFFMLLPHIFIKAENLSGIVGIVYQGQEFISIDFYNILTFMAVISLNLCVLNLLPIPVLDGGKVWMYMVEKIYPEIKKMNVALSIGGWVLMLSLMVYVTVLDIVRLTV